MAAEAGKDKPRLSVQCLSACSGCEIGLLNSGELLLSLFERVDIVHFPLLVDQKYSPPGQDPQPLRLPQADIGLVSGSVACEEQLELLVAMRDSCRILVAFGTCATHGGIPAMRNQWTAEQTLTTVYPDSGEHCPVPSELSPLLDRVYSLDEKVTVDLLLPGCPPWPARIVEVVFALADGKATFPEAKSVCDSCPTKRIGKGADHLERSLANAEYRPEEPLDRMRCLLEQGFLCMGPVTRGGCGGGEAPLCLRARVPCRGCYGPVRDGGNQLLDMRNALASNGIDASRLADRTSMLRFSGAHGLLRPVRRRG